MDDFELPESDDAGNGQITATTREWGENYRSKKVGYKDIREEQTASAE